MLFSRQTLKNVSYSAKNIIRGGYVLTAGGKDVTIFASGSEVELALKVSEELKSNGIKAGVSSFPCLEVFDKQSPTYKKSVLSDAKLKVAIEASSDTSWYKYLSENDLLLNIDKFGQSASPSDLDKYYGFTVSNIVRKIKNLLKK